MGVISNKCKLINVFALNFNYIYFKGNRLKMIVTNKGFINKINNNMSEILNIFVIKNRKKLNCNNHQQIRIRKRTFLGEFTIDEYLEEEVLFLLQKYK